MPLANNGFNEGMRSLNLGMQTLQAVLENLRKNLASIFYTVSQYNEDKSSYNQANSITFKTSTAINTPFIGSYNPVIKIENQWPLANSGFYEGMESLKNGMQSLNSGMQNLGKNLAPILPKIPQVHVDKSNYQSKYATFTSKKVISPNIMSSTVKYVPYFVSKQPFLQVKNQWPLANSGFYEGMESLNKGMSDLKNNGNSRKYF